MQERIDGFVKAADELSAEYWQRSGFTHASAPVHRADFISDKWVRVVTLEERGGTRQVTSVYAFIALKDYETKALGAIKAGDIHKPASFKVPAKHARGTVLADDFGRSCLTSHGPVYMR